MMVSLEPIVLEGYSFTAVTVRLPKTTLLTVSNENGYIMCGALDVGLLNEKLHDRKILAGRAVGVKTIEQLLKAPLESVTTRSGTTRHICRYEWGRSIVENGIRYIEEKSLPSDDREHRSGGRLFVSSIAPCS